MSLSRKLSQHYPKIPGYRLIKPRRCQVFGVGSPKTGTHSLVSVFAKHFRAMHEVETKREIALYSRHHQGLCRPGEIQQWFVDRSRRLWLECDVSHLHGLFAAEIAEAIPEAKFILTIRNPQSWLDSAFNQTLGRQVNQHWAQIREQVYGPLPTVYPEQETHLQQLGLYPIAAYLNRWAERIERVTSVIPAQRLLILKTNELKRSAARIADFCQIDQSLLSDDNAHQFTAVKKAGVLDQIDKQYLDALIEQRCGRLLERYFSN